MKSYDIAKQKIKETIENEGIEAETSFIGGEVLESDWPCISYVITYRNGKAEFKTPYHLGVGHVDWSKAPKDFPSIGYSGGLTNDDWAMINMLRHNRHVTPSDKAQWASTAAKLAKLQKVKPDTDEALATVCRDAKEAVETFFGEWATNFGYDPDSRKAEQIHRAAANQYPGLLAIMSRDTIDKLAELSIEL
jgi:hypothetical protein